jgi:hypothetical protein
MSAHSIPADGAAPLTGLPPIPYLAGPPRPVPFSIQWQLFRGKAVFAAGCGFAGVSVFFIILFATGAGDAGLWRFFPLIHLAVGLGLMAGVLVQWRRRVTLLKHGLLAPARIVAIQDRGSVSRDGENVVHLSGPWEEFETGFEKARHFWKETQIPVGPGVHTGLAIMGCAVGGMALFGAVFAVAAAGIIWLGNAPGAAGPAEKLLWTLGVLTLMAVYMAILWVFKRALAQMNRAAAGATLAAFGIEPTACCRFVFALPDGSQAQATAAVDLRTRLDRERADPDDLALYLPSRPEQALLLGGFLPPLGILDGAWVRGISPDEPQA